MVSTGNWRKRRSDLLLIILIGLGLVGLALPGTAASQELGGTEIEVSPDEVIVETEVIPDSETIFDTGVAETGEGEAAGEVWKTLYTGSNGGNSSATAMTVDGQGNVYVTGRTKNLTTGWDYCTIKYSSSGQQLWSTPPQYDSGAKSFDEARAIVVDGAGNVYVTGYSTGNGTGADFATIKYSPNGEQLWPTTSAPNRGRYNGPGNWDDFATAIALDNLGNIYVTGASEGNGTGWDYVTIKYNPGGTALWVRRYNYNEANNMAGNRHDVPAAIAVDGAGNVYVTGSSWRSRKVNTEVYPYYDYATIKYDTDGVRKWAKRFFGQNKGHDYGCAIALDTQGNVYVTGSSQRETTGYDFYTIAYKQDSGTVLWASRYCGLLASDHAYARAIATDKNNQYVYVTGLSFRDGQSANYTTVKYPLADGKSIGVRSYDGLAHGWDEPTAIAVDAQGNVYVTGSITVSATNSDYCTIRYGTDFGLNWTRRYGLSGGDGANAIALDGAGNVYVTGFSARTGTGETGWNWDWATLKYAP